MAEDESPPRLEFPEPSFNGSVTRINILFSPVGATEPVVKRMFCLCSNYGRYVLMKKIQDCMFGVVYEGMKVTETCFPGLYHALTPLQHFAVKIIDKGRLAEEGLNWAKDPLHEIAALQFVGNNHPNVMGQVDCISDDNSYYSVMNLAERKDLGNLMASTGRFNEKEACHYFLHILGGIERLHAFGIYHGNMCPENIVVTEDGHCKIIDLGLSIRFPRDENGNFLHIPRVPAAGKMAHMSPDNFIQTPSTFDGSTADIWSLGTILAYLLLGRHLFEMPCVLCENFRRFYSIDEGGFHSILIDAGIPLSDLAVDLILTILNPEPSMRPTLHEIRQHRWLKSES
mmetsp:Transcript_16973/g.28318  ORF Transcript_16973/g.28318 Transcript_16973/m.28318 type:complete len:342 (-) Transcript_16973:1270-2295(-)